MDLVPGHLRNTSFASRPEGQAFRWDAPQAAYGGDSCSAPGKAIVLARVIPIVRTVLNPMVGTLDVPTKGGRERLGS